MFEYREEMNLKIMDSEFANAVELSYECAPLLESLKEYSEKDIACFDVPGHVKIEV